MKVISGRHCAAAVAGEDFAMTAANKSAILFGGKSCEYFHRIAGCEMICVPRAAD